MSATCTRSDISCLPSGYRLSAISCRPVLVRAVLPSSLDLRSAGRVERVRAEGEDLFAVASTVAVRVEGGRVGAVDEELIVINQSVAVGIRAYRACAKLIHFLTVEKTIAV